MLARRHAEVLAALAAAGIGATVVAGAWQHDTGWGATGPGAGYFPLRVGLLLVAASLLLAARAAATSLPARFAEPGAMRRVMALFLPTVIFGALIGPLGAYLSMLFYLLWMGRMAARLSWGRTLLLAVAVPAAFWGLFETWLGVPLAKGPIEEALGIW